SLRPVRRTLDLGRPDPRARAIRPGHGSGWGASQASRSGRRGHGGAQRPGRSARAAVDRSRPFRRLRAGPGAAVPGGLSDQPEHGGMTGFDFYRDPLGAMKPGMTFEEVYRAGVAS